LVAQGPSNSLDDYYVTPGQPWNGPVTVGEANDSFSDPTAAVNGNTGLITLYTQGESNSLQDYWVTAGEPWNGPVTIAGPGTTFDATPAPNTPRSPPTITSATPLSAAVATTPPVTVTPTPSTACFAARIDSAPKSNTTPLSRALAKCRKIKNHRKRLQCQAAAKHRYDTTKKKK
jgi:hypothetical protein